MRRAFGVLLALLAAWMALPAPAGACTDGVDCLCDTITSSDTIVFCEDFEESSLADGDDAAVDGGGTPTGAGGTGRGWYDTYGSADDNCWCKDFDPTDCVNGSGLGPYGIEGEHDWSCINVVQDGDCEGVDSDVGCVHDGDNSLMHRMRPGKTNGIIGLADFTGGLYREFGITMAVKWSGNYLSPKQGGGPAHKTNEFGDTRHCILGCSTNFGGSEAENAGSPFSTGTFMSSDPGGTETVGNQVHNGSSNTLFPATATWDLDDFDDARGTWLCLRVHYTNWGLSNAQAEYWIGDTKLIDVSGMDYTSISGGDASGIGNFSWNSYYNGVSTSPDSGYAGGTLAGRFEDNIVITDGDPVPCSAIGFGAAPDPDISIGTPVLTLDPVSGYAPVTVDASVPFSDAGGTVSLYVDCAGGTSWVDTGVSGTVSPLSAPDVCSYATQVGAPTAIAFRVVDGDGSDDDSDTAAISIAENPAKWAEGAITSLTGFYVDSPFLSYDSNRIYFLASPKAVTDYFAGTSTLPQWPALPGHQGDTDLYYVEWDGSAWGAPVNLGTEINTSDSECCMWVNEAETQIIFWRTGALTGATNLVATRASKADPWDTPSGMAGELGSVNQNPPTNYRTDINVDPATLDLYLWEHDSVTNGILQRAPWNGSGWDALVDLTALDDADDDDTQPVVSRDGLILLWNRRGSDAITELMRATRATTGDSWGTPASVTLNGFEDGASIQAWGELSFDGDEQGFVAVRFDTAVPGWAAHLIHVDGGVGASSYGPPVDLNGYVAPQKCTPENPCCCLGAP